MAHGPRGCIDRIVPLELRDEERRVAAQENPANRAVSAFEMALDGRKLWKPGRVLHVRFLGGSARVHAGIARAANVWTQFANITFAFDDRDDADIRIAFEDTGSWSAIGTDALVRAMYQPSEATMNFGWLTDDSVAADYDAVVLHEFGHALGCIHEHQNPDAGIKWDKATVYRDLGFPPNNWDKDMVDENIFRRYSAKQTQFSEFDPASIMTYALPFTWTRGGQAMQANTTLSDTDKAFISARYPRGV